MPPSCLPNWQDAGSPRSASVERSPPDSPTPNPVWARKMRTDPPRQENSSRAAQPTIQLLALSSSILLPLIFDCLPVTKHSKVILFCLRFSPPILFSICPAFELREHSRFTITSPLSSHLDESTGWRFGLRGQTAPSSNKLHLRCQYLSTDSDLPL